MNHRTLVLNSDYTPLNIVSWRHAFKLIYTKDEDGAYLVHTYDKTIKDSAGRVYNLPAVIVTKKFFKEGSKRAVYSKINIKLRDRNTCQYCGGKFPISKLNVDHVIPRCKEHLLPKTIKLSSWENVVTSCYRCNSQKNDRLLKECGLSLIRVPKAITKAEKLYLSLIDKDIPPEWEPYIKKSST